MDCFGWLFVGCFCSLGLPSLPPGWRDPGVIIAILISLPSGWVDGWQRRVRMSTTRPFGQVIILSMDQLGLKTRSLYTLYPLPCFLFHWESFQSKRRPESGYFFHWE